MRKLLWPLALLLAACAPPQERTRFELEVLALKPSEPNEHGWSIALDEARIRIGPLRFFEGKVLLSRVVKWLWVPFGGVAQAHPGHYVPGEALAEWLSSAEVDLLSDAPVRIGTAEGFTGAYGSLHLELPAAEDGLAIVLRGTASKDGDERPFEATFESKRLEGIRAEGTLDTTSTVARLTLDLATWLGRIDFATTTEAEGRFVFSPDTQALNAFTRGVADTGAWTVVFAPDEAAP